MNIRIKKCMVAAMVLTAGLMTGVALAELPPEAETMRGQYEEAVRTLQARGADQNNAILRHYHQQLGLLKTKYQQAGDLPGLQAVMNEQSRLEQERNLPAAEPALETLKTLCVACRNYTVQNETQVARDTNVLAVRYYTALEALERRLTQEGKIAPATDVMEYRLAFMKSLPPAPEMPKAPAAAEPPPAPVPAATEKSSQNVYTPRALIDDAGKLMGTKVEVSGVVRNLGGLDRQQQTAILHFEDNLSAYISVKGLDVRPWRPDRDRRNDRREDGNGRNPNMFWLYVDDQQLLPSGGTVVLRGTLERQLQRYVLTDTTVLEVSDPDSAKLLGIRLRR